MQAFFRREGNAYLITIALLYTLIYVIFWPKAHSIMDESAYLAQGYAFRHGTPYTDVAGISSTMSYEISQQHTITQYPLGMPLLLALFSLISWKLALGINLFTHLATFGLIAALLRLNKKHPWPAVLYLLHPTAALYSHTVMTDVISGTLITLTVYLTLTKRFALAGLVIGAAVLIRTANWVIGPLIVLGMLLDGLSENKSIAKTIRARFGSVVVLTLAAVPLIVSAYLYQKIIQDGGWARYSQGGQLALSHIPGQFLFYAPLLLILYPGMFALIWLYRGVGRFMILATILGIFLLYCSFFFHDTGGSLPETLVIGQRYMLSILPLCVVAYASVFEPWLKKIQTPLMWGVALVLLAATSVIHRQHDAKLREVIAYRDALVQSAPRETPLFCNVHLAKLLHPAWTEERRWTLISGFNAQTIRPTDASDAAIQAIQKGLTASPSVIVAMWNRGYRSEASDDTALLKRIQSEFTYELLPNLPAGLIVLRVKAPL
jgi:hypothetical protein